MPRVASGGVLVVRLNADEADTVAFDIDAPSTATMLV